MTDDELEEEFKTWDLPYVEQKTSKVDLDKTNALNRKSDWKYEPPEPEIEILPPTAEEIEAIRAAAHAEGFADGQKQGEKEGYQLGLENGQKEGYEKGLEQGTQEGLASGVEQIQQNITLWESLIESIQNPITKVEHQLEQELVLLAVSLARAVIRSEVKTNHDLIFQALSEGLKVLPIQEKHYQIRLHPEDIVRLNNHFSEEELTKHRWDLVADPELSAGGCEIVTDSNAVDLSVERRVRGVIDKFLLEQGLSHVAASSDD
ncbi:MAG: flagellar assembly protein FliH [Paraglaciecola sp.]|uniref:flagellar assembly protein FliH n=1 Tax=Paraglaciecola sp. TaxID=1920173 RepID=UPI003297E16E